MNNQWALNGYFLFLSPETFEMITSALNFATNACGTCQNNKIYFRTLLEWIWKPHTVRVYHMLAVLTHIYKMKLWTVGSRILEFFHLVLRFIIMVYSSSVCLNIGRERSVCWFKKNTTKSNCSCNSEERTAVLS